MGRQIRNSVPAFQTQMSTVTLLRKPARTRGHEQVGARKSVQHKAQGLPSIGLGTDVFVKDLQLSGKVVEASFSNSLIFRNCVSSAVQTPRTSSFVLSCY